jgi:8-oxo-dGTP diphosphatase
MKQVVCALIIHEGKLLITQHGAHTGHPLSWEFPGGKIQEGEIPEEALIREILEELNIFISVEMALHPVEYQYPGKVIRLMPYLCRWSSGEIELSEHNDSLWIEPGDVFAHDMLPADFKMLRAADNLSKLLQYAGKEAQEGRKHNTPADN